MDKLTQIALMGALLGGGWSDSGYYPAIPKVFSVEGPKETKCGLPSCNNMSKKDYCSAQHCKEHRELQRKQKKLSI